ncbi:ParB/RepB/Spo0J family partition protein [Microbacterium sp. B2969]|uniref:ParB/RepB/Spo0J family partition protein n=1 Tax=Microbacterium alkaliflavum TaxID=3248839 RepID=A0ABW7Q9Z8_9MICO
MSTPTALRGTIEYLNPNTLAIEENVRPSAPLTKEFVQSIRENGVLTPVLARRRGEQVIVRAGQRRTLAAIEAGVEAIPVYVVDANDATAERIIQQMVENDHRESLNAADRAAAFQQLVFEGLGVATIAKRTGTKQAEVKTGLAVADNPAAASAAQQHALTLDQAAMLIEFDDDPDAREKLIEVATTDPAQFAHAAQRVRDEKARAKAKADAEADLTARGFTILEKDYFYDGEYTRISELITAEGERVTADDIADADGRAASVWAGWDGGVQVTYLIADPKAAGFKKGSGSGSGNGPLTDEQKEERRTLIANSKAWASAETVRREWLATLLSRKTLPKDAAAWVARALTFHRHTIGAAISAGNVLAHDLLCLDPSAPYSGQDNIADLLAQHPTRAQHVTLAIILGGIESATSRETWRRPTGRDADYFAMLSDWGYTLSDVERIVVKANGRDAVEAVESVDPEGDVEQASIE